MSGRNALEDHRGDRDDDRAPRAPSRSRPRGSRGRAGSAIQLVSISIRALTTSSISPRVEDDQRDRQRSCTMGRMNEVTSAEDRADHQQRARSWSASSSPVERDPVEEPDGRHPGPARSPPARSGTSSAQRSQARRSGRRSPGGRPPRSSSPRPRRGARSAPSRRPRGRRPPSGRAGGCGSAPARPRCRGPGRPGPARAAPRRAAPRRRRRAAPIRSAPARARWISRWAAVNSAVRAVAVAQLGVRRERPAYARHASASPASAQRRTPAVSITVRARQTSRTWTGSSRRTWVPLLGTRSARPSATRIAERLAHGRAGDAERVGQRDLAQRRTGRAARPRTATAAAPRRPGRRWRRELRGFGEGQ